MDDRLVIRHLGLVEYGRALETQLETHASVLQEREPHTLLLLEHPPVYTLGKRGGRELFLGGMDSVLALGADVVSTDRGGLVTFHGPGQLVGYPIIHLGRLGISLTDYIGRLLAALTAVLERHSVAAAADMTRPGVFAGEKKIGAVGVRLRDGATYHGFAVNVTTDLTWFDHIVACGLTGVRATSILAETGGRPAPLRLGREIGAELALRLGLEAV